MPFVLANVKQKPATTIGSGVRVGLRYGLTGAPRVTFFLTSDRAAELGWAAGDRIEVMLGEKSDHGLVRMRKAEDGQVQLTARKTAHDTVFFQLQLGAQPAFVNQAEKAASCPVEVLEDEDAGTIEIVLPPWADETHPDRKPRAGVMSATETVAPRPFHQTTVGSTPPPAPAARRGRPPKSVTAGLMGDPAPGRREMLAKMGEMKA